MKMESSTRSSANMYRIGDYVFVEISPTIPYQIRRIEELNKTLSGVVEAKAMCFFRRRDLPTSLTFLADRHQSALEEEEGKDKENLTPKERHLIQHRELFLSRQVETLPATQIRGKCSVTLLNETENLQSYLSKDDVFYYSLVYDPQQKTLLADRGEIRVGQRYQADGPLKKLKEGEVDDRKLEELETLVWTPDHGLTDKQIDQFLVISRSVGTFARALDCSSSVKQPSLHMSAAGASRDVTLLNAMDILHNHSYDMSQAISALVPSTGPVLCRDEMEEWSASEANLFEEALEKYGKDFQDIRSDFLPWKTLKNIIEYYYMWKTTDRYVQQKRVKAAEAETKLKQVYIPNYNKQNAHSGNKMINGNSEPLITGKPCESCSVTASTQWYSFTGSSGIQTRLCSNCWTYWRKYGGIKNPNKKSDLCKPPIDGEIEILKKNEDIEPQVERPPGLMQSLRLHRCAVAGCGKDFKMKSQLGRHYAQTHGFSMRSGSPRPVMKTRTTAFYLHTTTTTRIARRVCNDILKPRHATRAPFYATNANLIKQEFIQRTTGKVGEELLLLIKGRKRKMPDAKVTEVAHKLGQADRTVADWLILTEKSKMPKPERESFPKPPKAPDGSLIYERVPEKHIVAINNISPNSLIKRRGYDDFNGIDGPPAKKMAWDGQGQARNKHSSREGSPVQHLPPTVTARNLLNQINGKTKVSSMTRVGSRKQIISWMVNSTNDAPDDLYFCSNFNSKKLRKNLTSGEMRRLARTPTKQVIRKSLCDAYNYMPHPAPVVPVPPIVSPAPRPPSADNHH